MKIGKEVEGRLKGLDTLFMSAQDFVEKANSFAEERSEIFILCMENSVNHVYVSDLENELDLQAVAKFSKREAVVVTVERTALTERVPSNINVMLAMDYSSFQHLKETDQVKFSRDLYVHCIPKESMYKTIPSDFAEDKTLGA